LKILRLILLLASASLLGIGACTRPPEGTVENPEDATGREVEYTVRDADTWSSISELFFGDASRAERIARDNASHPAVAPVAGVSIQIRILVSELDVVRAIAEARGSYNAGVEAMQRDGGDEDAAAAFERALERAPHFVDARYNLGLVQLRLGEPKAAKENFAEVVKARPEDPDAWYGLAASSFHAGDYAAAMPPLEQALTLAPDMLRARWTHALCLERMGRGPEAIEAWRRYLQLDPDSAWADQARTHLAELGA
jgi:tetratricopeptide (TPR) repeat protein